MNRRTIKFALAALALQCNNIGFVEKAKAVANNSFGIEVFVVGGSDIAQSMLTVGGSGLSPSCVGSAGIEKANCACTVESAGRGFSGTYRAWLSITGTVDAICNIQGQPVIGCEAPSSLGPFLLRNSTGYQVLAADFAELSTSGIRVALESSVGLLMTGTGINGRATGADCGGFQVTSSNAFTAGDKSKSGTGFTTGESGTVCNAASTGAILCMRQTK